MQNKANLLNVQMSVRPIKIRDYVDFCCLGPRKNKPKQTQFPNDGPEIYVFDAENAN